jgi:FolB domain-containing protein
MQSLDINLEIPNLNVPVTLGWSAEERAFPQIISVSISAQLKLSRVFSTDNLEDTENYVELVEKTKDFVSTGEWRLVEMLLFQLVRYLFNEFKLVQSLKISIEKRIIPDVPGIVFTLSQKRCEIEKNND